MEKIKCVVVGLNFGKWVIDNELLEGKGKDYIDFYGVCDLNQQKAQEFAQKYGVKYYAEYDQVLADQDVEAVILITGPIGRAALVKKAILAKKPVMTTKPFDISSQQTLEVLRLAEKEKIPVFMNSPTPVAKDEIRVIENWIRKYNLGRPVSYYAETYCSYWEQPDGSWYDDPKKCPVAPIYRLGIYLLNDLCRFFSPAEKIQVLQSRLHTKRPTVDNAQLSILHKDGTIGTVFASFCIDDLQYYRCSMQLHFEKGTIYKNVGPKVGEEISMQLVTNQDGVMKQIEQRVVNEGAGYLWDVFYQGVRNTLDTPTISPEQVASVIRIIEEAKAQSV